jgi:hypothetical protein
MVSQFMASQFMASQFEIGDKVDQNHSNHVEGTVVAIFTNKAGERNDFRPAPAWRCAVNPITDFDDPMI